MCVSEGTDVSTSVSESECRHVPGNVCFIVCRESPELDMIVGRFSGRQR